MGAVWCWTAARITGARAARQRASPGALDRAQLAETAAHIAKAAFTRADMVELLGAQLSVDVAGEPCTAGLACETNLHWPPRPAGRLGGGSGGPSLPARPQRGVLLTGATGFVGAHLLAALLEAGPYDVYALVRAAGVDAARERIVTTLAEQRLTDRVDLDRVVVLPGDLELREFGLGIETFARLGQRLRAIVHNGGAGASLPGLCTRARCERRRNARSYPAGRALGTSTAAPSVDNSYGTGTRGGRLAIA